MLSQMEENALFLEDFEDFIKLEIPKAANTDIDVAADASISAKIAPASYTETSMVIVSGFPKGNVLQVLFMSPPPIEARLQTLSLATYPNYAINFFDSAVHMTWDR